MTASWHLKMNGLIGREIFSVNFHFLVHHVEVHHFGLSLCSHFGLSLCLIHDDGDVGRKNLLVGS